MKTGEARRMHPPLDPREIVGVLGEKPSSSTQRLEQQVISGNMVFMGGSRDIGIRQSEQVEEVEEHPIRILRVRSVSEQPGTPTEYIERHIREDAVVEVIDELGIMELREIHS